MFFHCKTTTCFCLQDYGDSIFTIRDVVEEIKDVQTRERLQVLPYEIQFREPTEEDLKYVVNFSKRTGDFRQLSATDIRLVALTVRLEKELNGGANLREAPKTHTVVPVQTSKSGLVLKHLDAFGYDVDKLKNKLVKNVETDEDQVELDSQANEDNHPEQSENDELQPNLDDASQVSDEDENQLIIEEDEGWITQDNVEQLKQKLMNIRVDDEESVELTLGCITGDYAMQNLLMQMGLNVISPKDGLHIRQTRQFVLRCHACFKINPPTATTFCKHCGNMKTLKRVSVQINQDGTSQVLINFKKPINIRGTKYSIPLSRGGKHSNDPILCEDQRKVQHRKSKMSEQEKKHLTVSSILNDPDYLVRSNPFSVNDVYSRGSRLMPLQRKTRNPNETRKPTGNRKNKSTKH